MPKTQTKKTSKTKKEEFNLENELNKIFNPYLRAGFKEYIQNFKVRTQTEYDKLYKQFEGGE